MDSTECESKGSGWDVGRTGWFVPTKDPPRRVVTNSRELARAWDSSPFSVSKVVNGVKMSTFGKEKESCYYK